MRSGCVGACQSLSWKWDKAFLEEWYVIVWGTESRKKTRFCSKNAHSNWKRWATYKSGNISKCTSDEGILSWKSICWNRPNRTSVKWKSVPQESQFAQLSSKNQNVLDISLKLQIIYLFLEGRIVPQFNKGELNGSEPSPTQLNFRIYSNT